MNFTIIEPYLQAIQIGEISEKRAALGAIRDRQGIRSIYDRYPFSPSFSSV